LSLFGLGWDGQVLKPWVFFFAKKLGNSQPWWFSLKLSTPHLSFLNKKLVFPHLSFLESSQLPQTQTFGRFLIIHQLHFPEDQHFDETILFDESINHLITIITYPPEI